ncbi:L-fuculose-phosphate aldolase [Thermus arciformis]|uniref:L-fuculose-phosphate aldolase n=2 Tax=Thermus arciformis TaxID=482827 RepID=A0A1G7FW87_9DEIN|nr:L-fuculose-phosphate aldolase [Thermus arciformis]
MGLPRAQREGEARVHNGAMLARVFTAFRQVGEDLFRQRLISATAGNFSVRTKEGFLITKSGVQKAHLTPEDLLEVPLEGPIPEGASVESVIHREVYRRTGAQALVHAHPRVAVALSLELDRILPLDLEGQYYLKEVPVLAPKTVSATEEAALSVAEALARHPVCLLRGHGAFALGSKEKPEEALLQAYSLMTTLEESAEILLYRRLWGRG